jgi:hypothetical protein
VESDPAVGPLDGVSPDKVRLFTSTASRPKRSFSRATSTPPTWSGVGKLRRRLRRRRQRRRS